MERQPPGLVHKYTSTQLKQCCNDMQRSGSRVEGSCGRIPPPASLPSCLKLSCPVQASTCLKSCAA